MHASRLQTICASVTTTRCHCVRDPQMNKFEQVSSDGHREVMISVSQLVRGGGSHVSCLERDWSWGFSVWPLSMIPWNWLYRAVSPKPQPPPCPREEHATPLAGSKYRNLILNGTYIVHTVHLSKAWSGSHAGSSQSIYKELLFACQCCWHTFT